MSDQDFMEEVYGMLARELGLGGYARFLRLMPRPDWGNYTEDRHQWLDGIDIEKALEESRATKAGDSSEVQHSEAA